MLRTTKRLRKQWRLFEQCRFNQWKYKETKDFNEVLRTTNSNRQRLRGFLAYMKNINCHFVWPAHCWATVGCPVVVIGLQQRYIKPWKNPTSIWLVGPEAMLWLEFLCEKVQPCGPTQGFCQKQWTMSVICSFFRHLAELWPSNFICFLILHLTLNQNQLQGSGEDH